MSCLRFSCWVVGSLAVGLMGAGATGLQVAPEKELLIIDPRVVDSPMADYPGPWSIGHLFDEMAADGKGELLMLRWLETWLEDQTVSGEPVAARAKMRELVIEPWKRADGWEPGSGVVWKPNLGNAPFRLLAVVNRIDLAQVPGQSSRPYYGPGPEFLSPPQGRLVFAVLGEDGSPLANHFTVIFEYAMSAKPLELVEVAKKWRCLSELEFGRSYRFALAELTRSFTDHRVDEKTGKRLPPPLLQARTNEMALDDLCELREFRLGKRRIGEQEEFGLMPAPLVGTPSMRFAKRGSRETRALSAMIHEHVSDLEDVEEEWAFALPPLIEVRAGREKEPVLAGAVTIPNKRFHWFPKRVTDPDARLLFSRSTCNGCHAADTGTTFCHIRPREKGQASALSDFLRMDARPSVVGDPSRSRRKIQSTEMADRIAAYLRVVDPELKDHHVERSIRRSRTVH